MKNPILSIIIPCLNEEDSIPYTVSSLLNILKELEQTNQIDSNSFIFFVNDGSNDKTWELIQNLIKRLTGKLKELNSAEILAIKKL